MDDFGLAGESIADRYERDPVCSARFRSRRLWWELFDRVLIVNEHHLRQVLTEYLQHYNTARPHRALGQFAPVRAENRIHGSDQQSCSPGAPPMMITYHVPAVGVPPDHAASRGAAAGPACGDMEDRRDPAPAPPARRPTTAAAARPEAELGGPGPARGSAGPDTESAAPGAAAAGHPRHDRALAPRHRPPPLGRQVHARQDRPPGHPPEHQGPSPSAGPGKSRMGVPDRKSVV